MAKNTIIPHYIPLNANIADADRPLGAGFARIALNNPVHIYDQSGQVLCKWVQQSSTDYLTPSYTFTRLWDSSNGSLVPLLSVYVRCRKRLDDQPFEFRVRLAGASSDNSTSCTFAVCVEDPRIALATAVDGDSRFVYSASTTSSTMAWLGQDTIEMSYFSRLRSFARRSSEVIDGLSIGAPNYLSRETFIAAVSVFASRASASTTPRLGGVIVEEFVGSG